MVECLAIMSIIIMSQLSCNLENMKGFTMVQILRVVFKDEVELVGALFVRISRFLYPITKDALHHFFIHMGLWKRVIFEESALIYFHSNEVHFLLNTVMALCL